MLTLGTRHLSEGDRLGKYEVLRHIATGSIAELYLARIVGIDDIDKLVVIKRLLPQYVSNSSFVEIFLNEARLSATLQHQNITQVHDIGIANGNFFFAMEYIHGEDLDRVTIESQAKRVPISLDAALTLVSGLCGALHYAHEKAGADGLPLRIVHRDISPSNVLVSHAGAVKLLDFGVARAMSLQQRATRGGIKGKIAYVSPEQCRSSVGIDQRSDIFSVGVVLYQLTTGRLPFTGETEYEVLYKIVNETAPAPRTIVADYPRSLESIVMRALAPDVEHRYSTALELQTDLEDFAHTARLRISTLVLTRLMSTLFPSGTKEWNHARAVGESFVEQRVAAASPVVSGPVEAWAPRPSPQASPRCSTQGRARRPSTIQPPRAGTRGRTESVIPSVSAPRRRTESIVPYPPAPRGRIESGIPSAPASRGRTELGIPSVPAPRGRIVTIPPLRSDCAPAMGVPIMAMASTPSATSTAVPIAIPSSSETGDAETTRQLATVQGVFAPLEPSHPAPLPRLAVRPLATPVPGSQRLTPPPSQSTDPGEPSETPVAVRPGRAGRWLLRGLAFACISLAVGVTVETESESSERALPSNVTRSSPAPSAPSDVPAAPEDVPAMLDPVAEVAAKPTARGDAGESDDDTDGIAVADSDTDTDGIAVADSDTDVVTVSLRLDEPPATVEKLPSRPRGRGARVVPSRKPSRPRAGGSAVPESPAFDAWKYMPAGSK